MVAWLQEPSGDCYRPRTGSAWWLHPIETNAWRRVPGPFDANAISRPSGSKLLWVVGSQGTIIRSGDGGETWQRQDSRTDADLAAVQFIDTERGWAAGDRGTLRATTDGGRHWEERPSGTSEDLFTLSFSDAQHGWAAGLDGVLITTSNGGQRWRSKPRVEFAPFALRFLDSANGWAAGQGIYKTTDGGDHWARVGPKPEIDGFLSLFFLDPRHGWATAVNGDIFATTDGGATWFAGTLDQMPQTVPDSWTHRGEQYAALFFVDEQRGWAASRDGIVVATDDGGHTWHHQAGAKGDSLVGINFTDRLRGCAVGNQGHIIATDDGGAHWHLVASGAREGLAAVAFADSRRGWCAGRHGTILATTDGGASWDPQDSGTRQGLNGICFRDARHGWAVGDWASIVATRDSGRTWNPVEGLKSPYANVLHAVSFRDLKNGWAVGEDTVYKTADGGSHWELKIPSTYFYLLSVQLLSGSEKGWAVTRGGSDGAPPGDLLTTSDGWKTWTTVPPRDKEFWSLSFADSQQGWGVGSHGGLWATTDGGKSWLSQASQTSADLMSVCSLDRTHGWAVGDGGAIMATTDGTHWHRQPSPIPQDLRSVSFGDRSHGAAVSLDGVIVVTADGGRTWSLPRYSSWPAPWYYCCLPIVGLMWVRAWRVRSEPPSQQSAADLMVSDSPIGVGDFDALDLQSIATGLSQFIRNVNTTPPVTIAVTAPWGFGKSSLMRLLESDLRRNRLRPVWFNAWHHQTEDHMLAFLLEAIRRQSVPSWFSFTGLRFRMRLLWLRGPRHTAPALALLSILALCAGLLARDDGARLLAITRALAPLAKMTEDHKDAATAKPVDFMGAATARPKEQKHAPPTGPEEHRDAAPTRPEGSKEAAVATKQDADAARLAIGISVAALGALGGLLALLKGILKAFGVKPAVLLKESVAGVRIRGLQARTSLRMVFQRQFADVTSALAPHRLVIFIDDLDRCHPERVTQTLEAVNFLVSSGECFIVLGMAPAVVEASVGLGFKNIAAELGGEDKADAVDGRELRREYARAYLQKLVNIEVAVPRISEAQAMHLLGQTGAAAPQSYATRLHGWYQQNRFLFLLPLMAIAVAAGVAISDLVPVTKPTRSDTTQEPPAAPAAPAPMREQVRRNLAPVPPPPRPAAIPAPIPPSTPPAAQSPVRWRLVLAFPLVPFAIVLYWVLTRRPDARITDSPRFKRALEIWRKPIVIHTRTPRELKRFVNWVRYLAMRFRQPVETRTPIERFLSWLERGKGAAAETVTEQIEGESEGEWEGERRESADSRGRAVEFEDEYDAPSPELDEAMLIAMAALAAYDHAAKGSPNYASLTKSHSEIGRSVAKHKRAFGRLPTKEEWERYRAVNLRRY